MDIDRLRDEIDRLDAEILALLNERAERVIEIGQMKEGSDAPVFDPVREQTILNRLTAKNRGPLPPERLPDIWAGIFAVSRLLEKPLVVAYYGGAGSFTHIAAHTKFGSADLRPADTISDCFHAVEKREADLAVVPVENTTAGVVPLTLDAFMESTLEIRAETYVDIEHYLLSHCKALEEIARVYSHPQALAQCRLWLRAHLPRAELVPVSSTARAAELTSGEEKTAAVGPALAGELHGVPVLRSKIHDLPDNRTRFFVLGPRAAAPTRAHDVQPEAAFKTSLLFSVSHTSGALHRALGVLSSHGINMTFIQSHPSKQTPWEYMFFVDVQGHAQAAGDALPKALEELQDHTLVLRVLGSYPEAH